MCQSEGRAAVTHSIDQLKESIFLGEDSYVEFKSQLIPQDRSSLADEIVVFASNEGGNISIGVSHYRDLSRLSTEGLDPSEKFLTTEIYRLDGTHTIS